MNSDKLNLTILVPVYNEEAILEKSIGELLGKIENRFSSKTYELILCENGSTDNTLSIANEMASQWPSLRVIHLPEASYGHALRHGISIACGVYIVIFNADFWDIDFLDYALGHLEDYDIIIGSKNTPGAKDSRPFNRRLITIGFNLLLRILFGFQGTDTHGIKAFKTDRAKTLANQCQTYAEIFDTELILRAQKAGHSIHEIAVKVGETRPSRYSPLKRIPNTLIDLLTLINIFWFGSKK